MIFPLRFKLALLSSVLLVGAIGTISLVVLERSAQALADEAGKRAVVLAQQLARNAREPLLLEDDLRLSQLLATGSNESEVTVTRVLDTSGRVIASSRDDEAEIRLDHRSLRRGIAALDPLGERDLLGGRQQAVPCRPREKHPRPLA